MKIEQKNRSKIIPFSNNPRINDAAVEKVAASIKEFGFKQPIVVDKDMVVIAGHTRLKAAEVLGLETVPVLVADDLTEEQVKAYRLADNKTAEFSEWNFDLLGMELFDIQDIDMEQFGFDMSQFEEPALTAEEDDYDPKGDAPSKVKIGEIWKLGGALPDVRR